MPDSRPRIALSAPPEEGFPAEFKIANGTAPDELLERLGCQYDASTRKWSSPRGHIVQTSGLRWHELRSKIGGFGSVSLILHCFGAKNPEQAIELIRSALPARFLSEEEREQLNGVIARGSDLAQEPNDRADRLDRAYL